MTITKKSLRRPHPETGRKVAYLVRVEGKRDPVTGKRRQYTRQVPTMEKAKELQSSWRAEIAKGTALDPSKTTVAEMLTTWLDTKLGEITAQSHRDYQIIIDRHLKPAFGTIKVQNLTAARIQAQYAAWSKEGMSARMVRGCHMRLSQALKMAVRFQLIHANPCDNVSPPKISRSKADVWSLEEASAFLHTAMNRPILVRGGASGRTAPDALHPLWHLLLLEGMRRGEALGLRWRDINFERGTAHIVQTVAHNKAKRKEGGIAESRTLIQNRTKTGAGARTVRLTARTLTALKEHRDRQAFTRKAAGDEWLDHDLIVCTSKGTPINPANVQRSFNAIVKATTLPDGTPLRRIRVHDLRHTAATMLLLGGVPAKIVSERLGHASIGITLDLYSHVLPDMQDEAADTMDRLFPITS